MNVNAEVNIMGKIPESQLRAVAKYQQKAYDAIKIRSPKGYRDAVMKPAAESCGMSVNEYIFVALAEKMKRDGLDYPSADEWKAQHKLPDA